MKNVTKTALSCFLLSKLRLGGDELEGRDLRRGGKELHQLPGDLHKDERKRK